MDNNALTPRKSESSDRVHLTPAERENDRQVELWKAAERKRLLEQLVRSNVRGPLLGCTFR